IESLTPAQEQALIAYRNKWLAIGRSTAPANRPAAEAAITRMYELLGHPKPRFWWSDGPAVGSIVRTLILTEKKGANLVTNLQDNLQANLWANLQDNLQDNLWTNLGTNLEANLGTNLRANLRANLQDNLWTNLGTNLWTNLWTNLGANLRANLQDN